jgi:hypothetical protein
VGLGSPVAALHPGGRAIPGLRGHQLDPPSVVLNTPSPKNPAYRVVLLVGSISRSVGFAPAAPGTVGGNLQDYRRHLIFAGKKDVDESEFGGL